MSLLQLNKLLKPYFSTYLSVHMKLRTKAQLSKRKTSVISKYFLKLLDLYGKVYKKF